MSIELLELAVDGLGELTGEVVFVGGATLVLWVTDPGAPPIRPTEDVDVIVEVTTRTAFHSFEERLRRRSFTNDQESGVICRWRHRSSGLVLDAMPADARLLGFENRWQAAALPHAITRFLPSGRAIRAVPPAFLTATKLEAFNGRGRGDFLGSRDFADVVTLIDGREELVDEIRSAPRELRAYLVQELRRMTAHPRFGDGLFGALLPDSGSQARSELVIRPRLQAIIDE